MLSIEGRLDAQKRVSFNRPYSCIKVMWGFSYQVLPKLRWTKRCIVWLDYDDPLDAEKLGDLTLLMSQLKSGSVVIVTVPVDPGEVDTNVNMAEKRLADLRSRVGRGKIRNIVQASHLSKWGLARVSRDIIHDHIENALNDRNASQSAKNKIKYQQLFNFHYADGVKMLTVGGLLTNSTDQRKVSGEHFRDVDFARTSEEPFRIDIPVLTLREIRHLDERLPRLAPHVIYPDWLPEDDRKRYGRVYRYFPSFTEVES